MFAKSLNPIPLFPAQVGIPAASPLQSLCADDPGVFFGYAINWRRHPERSEGSLFSFSQPKFLSRR
jgi:hypothetical protein